MPPELPIPTPNGYDSLIAVAEPEWLRFLPEGIEIRLLGAKAAVIDDPTHELGAPEFMRAGLVMRLLLSQAMKMGGLPDKVSAAWFIVTGDPEVVKRYGALHNCPACQAGTDQALAHLQEHPDDRMVVGVVAF